MDKPLVSVLMTAYNREKYIAEAIESVLASTYDNFELIIVDDCSTDNTVEIAKKFAAIDNRIKININDKNLGDYNNRNKAASYAVGKYLKYLDSDDIIYPWGLEIMVTCMEKFPEAGFGLMTQDFTPEKPLPVELTPRQSYLNFCFKGRLTSMGPTGAIIKNDAFKNIGGFSGKQYVGDTELWYALGAKYKLVCMPTSLIWWRQHEGQQIISESKNLEVKYTRYKTMQEPLLAIDCPLTENERMMAFTNVKNLYCRNIILKILRGNFKTAWNLKKMAKVSIYNLIISLKKNTYPLTLNKDSIV